MDTTGTPKPKYDYHTKEDSELFHAGNYYRDCLDAKRARDKYREHPFGTIKWYDGYHYFLCIGQEKVEAETALAYISYDFRRAFTLLGTTRLIEFYQGRSLQK